MCESKVMKMNKKEKLDNMLCEKNGVLQTADVIEAGISKTYFMEYAKKIKSKYYDKTMNCYLNGKRRICI